jgi:hypothetical protein
VVSCRNYHPSGPYCHPTTIGERHDLHGPASIPARPQGAVVSGGPPGIGTIFRTEKPQIRGGRRFARANPAHPHNPRSKGGDVLGGHLNPGPKLEATFREANPARTRGGDVSEGLISYPGCVLTAP